jgi:hypothetical protein
MKTPQLSYGADRFLLEAIERDRAETLRRRSAAPLKPKAPQIPCDAGLFSDEANQLDLVEQSKKGN